MATTRLSVSPGTLEIVQTMTRNTMVLSSCITRKMCEDKSLTGVATDCDNNRMQSLMNRVIYKR